MRCFHRTALLAALFTLALSRVLWGQVDPRWDTLNDPGVGGKTVSVQISPHDRNTMLLGGDVLGVGRTTDAGLSWQRGTGLMHWEMGDFTFHPTDANTAWVGSMGGPYKSTDNG